VPKKPMLIIGKKRSGCASVEIFEKKVNLVTWKIQEQKSLDREIWKDGSERLGGE